MIEQTIIAVCGISSVWLSQSAHFNARRWACVLGLLAQPAWLYATWVAQQWGLVILAIIYTVAWARGVRTYWFTKG